MGYFKNQVTGVQEDAREAFRQGFGLEAGLQYEGTPLEEVFVQAFKEIEAEFQAEYNAYLDEQAETDQAMNDAENISRLEDVWQGDQFDHEFKS